VANAPPAAARVAKPNKKPQKKVTRSVVIVITNSRSVGLTELDATPSGAMKFLRNLLTGAFTDRLRIPSLTAR
jgi:hypothetical protein